MKIKTIALFAAAAILPVGAASAQSTISGTTAGGQSWTATSTIIGTTSTATIAGGGNSIYLATAAKYRGTVGLLMHEAGGDFVCSGSLSADRMSIITAGHCVSSGNSNIVALTVTAYFYNPVTPDAAETPVYNTGAPNVTTVAISNIAVNPLYSGQVVDENDIAVLRLASAAPSFANGYSLYGGSDLTGLDYNTAGYGRRSDGGGSVGADLGTGRLRQGDNRYDFRLGDSDFGGQLNAGFFGETSSATTDSVWLADFDDGTAAHDASCGLAAALGATNAGTAKYCNTGRGATEALTAGGDSGGPQFVDGQLATITSFGLTFGTNVQPGDIDGSLNDTFGEFNGLVSISHNLGFLNSALAGPVPEPATWMMMILGFGMVGGAMRRRARSLTVTYA